jgi:hypothetical protein
MKSAVLARVSVVRHRAVTLLFAGMVSALTSIAPTSSWANSIQVIANAHPDGQSCSSTTLTTCTSGSSTGSQAFGSVDVATGVLEASASGTSTTSTAIGSAKITDGITLFAPAGYSGSTVSVTLSLVVPSDVVSGNAVVTDSLTLGTFGHETGCVAAGDQNCSTPGLIQGLNLSITANVPVGTDIFVQASLTASGGDSHGAGTASADPPALDLILPQGWTFTSESGVLLTEPLAVPGPIVGAGLPGLIFAGASLLGWMHRRRNAMAI